MARDCVSAGARSQKRPDVDNGEDDDPHRVDEVPVEGHRLPRHRADRRGAATIRREERRERDQAGEDVKAVQAREREERRTEERAARADALAQKTRVLAALTDEEDRAERDRCREPAAASRAGREGHRGAAGKEGDGKDRGAGEIEIRPGGCEPGVPVRDVREHDREKEDRLGSDEDRDPEEDAVLNNLWASPERQDVAHPVSLASGCLRSQSGRRLFTAGMLAKFSGGGGDVVDHSSVKASHGSSPAIAPDRRLRTRLTKKMNIATNRIAAPMVEMRFNGPHPVLAAYVNTRRGMPTAPSQCCGT